MYHIFVEAKLFGQPDRLAKPGIITDIDLSSIEACQARLEEEKHWLAQCGREIVKAFAIDVETGKRLALLEK